MSREQPPMNETVRAKIKRSRLKKWNYKREHVVPTIITVVRDGNGTSNQFKVTEGYFEGSDLDTDDLAYWETEVEVVKFDNKARLENLDI